ncbi:MAG: hypothetical protein AAGN35_12655 [Bacteroidota bacterium]
MSWHITVYPMAVRQHHESLGGESARNQYFEAYEELPKFSAADTQAIREHLQERGYRYDSAEGSYVHQEEERATAMLTDHAVYFMGKGGDAIMEISMTSGEFTYHYALPEGAFAVWDKQDAAWRV